MPNLYDFDDYDRCLQEFKHLETYCFVRAEVLPQADSEAWQAIAEISKYNKHHFDHRHLYYGLCLRWCKEDLAAAGTDVVKELYAGLLTNNTKVWESPVLFFFFNLNFLFTFIFCLLLHLYLLRLCVPYMNTQTFLLFLNAHSHS